MKIFSSIPFLRILIPFVAGILVTIFTSFPLLPVWATLALFTVAMSAGLLQHFLKPRLRKWLLLVTADVFLFASGAYLTRTTELWRDPAFYANVVSAGDDSRFLAVIDEIPERKAKTIRCSLRMLATTVSGQWHPVKGRILGYFRYSEKDSLLKAGNALVMRTRFTEIPPPLNPGQFDYRDYLRSRQIYHVAFVQAGNFALVEGSFGLTSLWRAGLACKSYILDKLRSNGLSTQAYAICSALLTGHDADIDAGVMEAFAHSGTLHVLSVSGLHTGLIYLVLAFLFDLADRRKKYKLTKFIFITISLWIFALIAGFSAPVLRAVIMFNLLGFGRIYFRASSHHQINILAASAFVLLFSDPFLIRNVGFLLSYFAMAGLFYFQPLFAALWQPSHAIVRYCWQSITASFAATLSTLPITLFVFKQFPLWFFICNLVVVPATFLLLLLALMVVLNFGPAAFVANLVVSALIVFIGLFDSGEFGYIDLIKFSLHDAVILSLLIILISAAFHYRSFASSRLALGLLVLWQLVSVFESWHDKQRSLFSVYHVGRSPAYSLKNRTGTMVNYTDPRNFAFSVKPHLSSFCYPLVSHRPFNFVRAGSTGLLIADSACFPVTDSPDCVKVLVITNNRLLRHSDLVRFPMLREVVADGSNNRRTVRHTAELCRKFGLSFYDTRAKGAYLLALNETEDRR